MESGNRRANRRYRGLMQARQALFWTRARPKYWQVSGSGWGYRKHGVNVVKELRQKSSKTKEQVWGSTILHVAGDTRKCLRGCNIDDEDERA